MSALPNRTKFCLYLTVLPIRCTVDRLFFVHPRLIHISKQWTKHDSCKTVYSVFLSTRNSLQAFKERLYATEVPRGLWDLCWTNRLWGLFFSIHLIFFYEINFIDVRYSSVTLLLFTSHLTFRRLNPNVRLHRHVPGFTQEVRILCFLHQRHELHKITAEWEEKSRLFAHLIFETTWTFRRRHCIEICWPN
jgi:hypothetical protein